ncbi:hypothetical protein [Alteromonas lipotrueae]|uniref:hypothetical protein n=1 Tax=Alteromonas lipotrueae TaxID=2803814 RepID=UPI001C452CD2|nr:hypothetical protein [Alteromonas lipotrueae]
MLFDILLKAGRFNEVTRQGRHINIVLAAGEMTARITDSKGKVFQTKMVSGMALELPTFERVALKSDNDQQTKVWISDVPLAYSPDTAREVGSNALISTVGQVFSSEAAELLPAQVGRNRITLTPEKDIFLGGSNLSIQNGVKLAAGQVFTMATQGAVWALETSGDYPPTVTTSATIGDVQAPTIAPTAGTAIAPTDSKHFIGRPQSDELLMFKGGNLRRVSADLSADLGAAGFAGNPIDDIGAIDHRGFYSAPIRTSSGYDKNWITINPDTLEVTQDAMGNTQGQSSSYAIDARGTIRAEYQKTVGLQISENGAPFAMSGVVVPDEGYIPYGMAITADNVIWLLTSNFLYKTADKGQTWQGYSTPETITSGGLIVDEHTGDLLVLTSSKTLYSFNGERFSSYLTSDGDFQLMHGLGGRVLIGSTTELFFCEGGEVFKFEKGASSTCRSLNITTLGKAYARYDDICIIVEGKTAKAGGLKVAIMSEVN